MKRSETSETFTTLKILETLEKPTTLKTLKTETVDFGDQDQCSQCNNKPNGVYEVTKLDSILPAYNYTHWLCNDCSVKNNRKNCIIKLVYRQKDDN